MQLVIKRRLQIIAALVFLFPQIAIAGIDGAVYSNGVNKKEAIKIAQQLLIDQKLDQEFILKPARIYLDKQNKIWIVAFSKKNKEKSFFAPQIGVRVVIEQDSGAIQHWGPDK